MIDFERLNSSRLRLKEENDCVVCSLAIAAQINYTRAHNIVKKSGRKHASGFWTDDVLPVAKKHGIAIDKIPLSGRMTVRKFCDVNKTGNYILESRVHALPVIDGVVMDRSGKNAIVTGIFKVEQKVNDVPKNQRHSPKSPS